MNFQLCLSQDHPLIDGPFQCNIFCDASCTESECGSFLRWVVEELVIEFEFEKKHLTRSDSDAQLAKTYTFGNLFR